MTLNYGAVIVITVVGGVCILVPVTLALGCLNITIVGRLLQNFTCCYLLGCIAVMLMCVAIGKHRTNYVVLFWYQNHG